MPMLMGQHELNWVGTSGFIHSSRRFYYLFFNYLASGAVISRNRGEKCAVISNNRSFWVTTQSSGEGRSLMSHKPAEIGNLSADGYLRGFQEANFRRGKAPREAIRERGD